MKLFISAIIMILIVALSYLADRKYPQKRIYIIPCGIILLCSVVACTSWITPSNNSPVSEEQRIAILNEQPYFITWYNQHKETINKLDRFCTNYHKIIAEYKNDTISTDETIERLQRLYDESNAFNQTLTDLLPPAELSADNYTLVYEVLEKTRTYSYKINETTRQSIEILIANKNNDVDKKTILNNLNRIYAIEGPIILDINNEVAQVKNNLTIPE
ncbi:hypothetical protein B5F82_07775 [Megamonas hypermegale]|uniref:hypothetical protein n=1 Tax=Megamonas hypermegale TaxID=158847 RepID=UPI000B3A3F5E|nr:hypothetical protein [Megamonas hypermegale]OUO39312.1 hypothetical protein B5F82_07775 [Megamonas hypermegale]